MLRGFRGWHERGYLPHRDEPGLTQLVTFRLADSFPDSLRSEWEHLLKIEDERERRKELEVYLDRGRGECHLRQPEIAKLMENTLKLHHGERYELRGWVVMPNHVHVLFKAGNTPMSRNLEDWKRYTAKEANKRLGRRGTFWQADYWDTYMRNAEHEATSRRYIENNPTKALLVRDPKEWPWSSARLRDQNGILRL
jgi:REP element-mobilizing transposase RayT